MKYLLTGCAGFIASKTAELLLNQGNKIVGIDNINNYYDVKLKNYRLNLLKPLKGFEFVNADIENKINIERLFKENKFDAVINLAARAGVRYSLINPFIYETTNAIGTLNLLEMCHQYKVNKFVLASTSSLYAGQKMPFKETLAVNTPISPYAASKKAAEVMCYTYHYQYGIDVSIVRYFTVYGPAGRPDMSIFKFIKLIDEGKPITLYGDGTQTRDFMYVDDIARGTIKAAQKKVGFEIINLGNNNPCSLNYVITLIEKNLSKKARFKRKPFNKSDLKATWADISKAKKLLAWKPTVRIEEGIEKTVEWYKQNIKWLKAVKLTD